jgi:hypothetical protein
MDAQVAEIALDTKAGRLIGWTVDIKTHATLAGYGAGTGGTGGAEPVLEFERYLPALLVAEEYFRGGEGVPGKSTATLAEVNALIRGCFRNIIFMVTLPVMVLAYSIFVLDMLPIVFLVGVLYYWADYPDDRRDEFDRTVDLWDGGAERGLGNIPPWARGWWVGAVLWVRDCCDWNELGRELYEELLVWREEPQPVHRLCQITHLQLRRALNSGYTNALRMVARARQ